MKTPKSPHEVRRVEFHQLANEPDIEIFVLSEHTKERPAPDIYMISTLAAGFHEPGMIHPDGHCLQQHEMFHTTIQLAQLVFQDRGYAKKAICPGTITHPDNVNGLTTEAVLACLIDRTERQAANFPDSPEYREAAEQMRAALAALHRRTQRRKPC